MDLQRHLNNEPVVASPPSKVYRLQKFIQRYRVTVSVTLALGTVLVVGIVVSSFLAVRANRAEREQTRLHHDALLAQENEARERSKAEQRLYESLLGQARALRIARRVGYRDKAIQLLQQAKALNLGEEDFSDLKQEAVACLGDFVGLTPVTFSDFPPETAISRACLDRSGKLAALGLTDGTILLRDLPSGKQVAQLKTELPPRDFCFNAQGDQLVSINYLPPPVPAEVRMQQSRIYIWGRRADNHWKMVDDIACPGAFEAMPCGDALCVVVFSYHPREGRILDLKTKSFVQVFNFPDWGDEWGTPCATVSPDGRLLAVEILPASGLHDDEIDVSDLKTGKLLTRLEPHRGDFSNLKFSPDSTELCCLSGGQGAVIYRISDFKPIAEFSGAFRFRSRPSFTHGDTIIAMPVGQQQNGIRLWDLIARQEVASLDEPEPAFEALFSNDERTLMTYGPASARVYGLDGTPEKLRLPGHGGVVPGMAFGPSGAWLASVGSDRKVRMWDCTTGRQNWVSEDLPGSGQSIASSPDRKLLVAGDSDTRLISFFEVSTGKLVGRLGTNSTGWNRSTQFTADGRYFLTGGGETDYNERLDIWDLTPGAQPVSQTGVEARLITHLPINSWSLVVAPDSHTLAFVDNPGEPNLPRFGGSQLYLWGINSTNPPRVLATNFIATSQAASFTPDSRRLLYADASRNVLTIDVASGREVSRFSTLERGRTRTWTDFPNLCLSPDGTKLAMVSASGLGVDLWAAENGKLIFSLPEQNGASVCSLAWAPDSQRLAIGRANGNIAIWSLPQINRALDRLGLGGQP
jgi:WD40 repeat protein